MNRPATRIQLHQGSVLIVSMLILLVLTLIGVTAMGTSALEEKMAGNSRDQNQAFQAAEITLRDAEKFLDGVVSIAGFNGTNGQYAAGSNPDIFDSATWSSTKSKVYSGTLSGVNTLPRYIVEVVNSAGQTSAMTETAYGESSGEGTITNFRITARGTGGTDSAVVLLQSFYGKKL